LFVIDDGVNDTTAARPIGDPDVAGIPESEPRSERGAVRDIAREQSATLPRDIARDTAKEISRNPIKDLAQDSARDAYREAKRERLRDPVRDPLEDLLRDAGRESPRTVLPPLPAPPLGSPPPHPQTLTVRTPWLGTFTVLVAVLGLIGAALLGWQLYLLKGQMDGLRAAVAQSGKVADAASRLSDTATQANEIANQALAGSTRPWIGVDTVEAGGIQAGQPLAIEVRVRNSGRTPSTDVQGLFLVYISPIDSPPALLTDQCSSCVRSVMLPNGTVSYKLSVRDNVMTADEVRRIKEGKDTMWIVGRLDYHDGEGEMRTTRSCLYYRTSGIASFTACSDGNSAD
jgi:hypothetical protein